MKCVIVIKNLLFFEPELEWKRSSCVQIVKYGILSGSAFSPVVWFRDLTTEGRRYSDAAALRSPLSSDYW